MGVRASERLAEIDMPYILRYQPVIRTVGQKYCMDPAVIAGVLSRESHGGNIMVNVGNVGDGIGVVQGLIQKSDEDGVKGKACNPSFPSEEVFLQGWSHCCKVTWQLENAKQGPIPTWAMLGDPGLYAPTSWISESQVSQIIEVLTLRIKEIQTRFPTWTPDQYLRGGLCAYAGGPGYIRSSQDLNCDFCNDVLARAKYFKRHGF
ncbi:lysozyme g-like protein 1 [Prionailurus iriomotensis]